MLKSTGSLVIIGGALRYDNHQVWQKIVDLAGGKGAKIAVFRTASRHPKKAHDTVAAFNQYGAEATIIPVAVKNSEMDYRQAVYDPTLIEQVRSATGIYFTGGEQSYITQALYTESGENTPMLDAIWHVYHQGGVIAGTSAGAAMMSTTMFADPPSVLEVMQCGVQQGKEIDRGLGFMGSQFFIDQHFLALGRLGRSLVAMQEVGYQFGFGVDENTALVVQNNQGEVIGSRGVLAIDLSKCSSSKTISQFNLDGIKLSYLESGDRYHLPTHKITVNPWRSDQEVLNPNDPDFNPYFREEKFYPDILAPNVVNRLLIHLIDSQQSKITALAFNPISSTNSSLGFEFTFHKEADSIGYYTSALGAGSYTVLNIYAAVKPIQMKPVLYDKFS